MTAYPKPSSPAVSAVMRGNRRRDTKPELRLRSALHARGLRYRVDYLIRTESLQVRPDIVFTKRRMAVFVDGCFFHACPTHGNRPRQNVEYWEWKLDRNVQRDQEVNSALEAGHWTVVRLWEHLTTEDCVCAILTALGFAVAHYQTAQADTCINPNHG